MAYRADNSSSALSIVVDNVATPAAGDVQAVKLVDGTAGSGAVIAGDNANGLDVDVTRVSGTVTVNQQRPATPTVTRVNASTAAGGVTILASNASRRDALLFNESTAILYLLYGTGTASATNYTIQIASGGYYECSYGYTGALKGLWVAANGAVQVTELT